MLQELTTIALLGGGITFMAAHQDVRGSRNEAEGSYASLPLRQK